ncbi:MAG: hypothetical protein JO022_14440 [Acidobacteriaceae bacterium]|nr:hypothetical protein [Acidobacteriaceae bacterium]
MFDVLVTTLLNLHGERLSRGYHLPEYGESGVHQRKTMYFAEHDILYLNPLVYLQDRKSSAADISVLEQPDPRRV